MAKVITKQELIERLKPLDEAWRNTSPADDDVPYPDDYYEEDLGPVEELIVV
jgi:hypothetical protein